LRNRVIIITVVTITITIATHKFHQGG